MNNNNLAIESFINFCDDMMIAEEGLKDIGNKAWITIKNTWAKIVTWFKNILLNVNRFKNATLDSKQNDDMIKILKMSQSSLERFFNMINMYYKLSRLLPVDGNGEHTIDKRAVGESPEAGLFGLFLDNSSSLEDQVTKVNTELSNALDSTKKSEEYKRFEENKYDNKNMKTIPLGNITTELQICNKMSTKYQGELNKIEKCNQTLLRAKKGEKLVSMMNAFFHHIIAYYTFRINILTKFFSKAKASLSGTINNVKEFVNDKESVKTNRQANRPNMKILVLGKDYEDTKKAYNDAIKAETYNEYKPCYDKLVKYLKCGNSIIEEVNFIDSKRAIRVIIIKDSASSVPVKNQKLYHSSPYENVKELPARWKTASNALFPEPRVYFHLNVPRNRYSGSKNIGHVYTPKVNPSVVFVDKELGSTAVFIKTDKPIPVEEIDMEKFKNDMNVKINNLSNTK